MAFLFTMKVRSVSLRGRRGAMSKRISAAAMVHLEKELGPERAAWLFDPGNVETVSEFIKKRLHDLIPTTMTVGERTYDLLSFLREDETGLSTRVVVKRAIDMNAHLGENDAQYLWDNQQDIPIALRSKVTFVFTDWRNSDNLCFIYWGGGMWQKSLDMRIYCWDGHDRVLRRKN